MNFLSFFKALLHLFWQSTLFILLATMLLGIGVPQAAYAVSQGQSVEEIYSPELGVQPDAKPDEDYSVEGPTSKEEEAAGARSLQNRFGWCDRLNPATFGPPIRTIDTRLLHGRKIELRYHPSSRCAWGRIRNGSPGDEIWVDRSNDGGHTWEPKLGAAKISGFTFPNKRYTEKYTVMFDNKNRLMRACGKAGNRAEIKCTKWY
jgi:hypothetical protein